MSESHADVLDSAAYNNRPVRAGTTELAAQRAAAFTHAASVLRAIGDACPALKAEDTVTYLTGLLTAANRPHVLILGTTGWSIEHPLTCSMGGKVLHECPVHRRAARHIDDLHDEWGDGRFQVWLDDNGMYGIDGDPDE